MEKYKSNKCVINNCLLVYFRDMVDVLYGGSCYMINQDELIPTIMKKLNKMTRKNDYETLYKIKKIKNIVRSALTKCYSLDNSENCYMCVILEKIYGKCNIILREKYRL